VGQKAAAHADVIARDVSEPAQIGNEIHLVAHAEQVDLCSGPVTEPVLYGARKLREHLARDKS